MLRLKNELKTVTESLKNMKKKYIESEIELKSKTEQAEILKSEAKDLRMIIKLREKLDEKDSNTSNKMRSDEAKIKEDLEKHKASNHKQAGAELGQAQFSYTQDL